MMGKTAIMKIMERACGHEVNVGDRVFLPRTGLTP